MILNQTLLFILYVAVGFIIGFLFDLFRSIRKSINTSNIATYIEDIVFFMLVGYILIFTIFKYNFGELRLYTLVGLLIGFLPYYLWFSKFIIMFNVSSLNVIIKLIKALILFLIRIYNKFKFAFLKIKNKFKKNEK